MGKRSSNQIKSRGFNNASNQIKSCNPKNASNQIKSKGPKFHPNQIKSNHDLIFANPWPKLVEKHYHTTLYEEGAPKTFRNRLSKRLFQMWRRICATCLLVFKMWRIKFVSEIICKQYEDRRFKLLHCCCMTHKTQCLWFHTIVARNDSCEG